MNLVPGLQQLWRQELCGLSLSALRSMRTSLQGRAVQGGCVAALLAASWGAASLAGATTGPGTVLDPLERAALLSPRALHAVTLGLARAGDRLVAVGERGIVLLSDDSGQQWRQVPVPVSVTLTAVQFVDARQGWAIGHSGVVLHTVDGGEHWQRQLDGQGILDVLKKSVGPDASPQLQRQIEQFVSDGPDKPLLGIQVRSATELLVVGAYGLALKSTDGGQHWVSLVDRMENPKGLHLNAIAGRGDTLLVVGEQGLIRISRDGGEHFTEVSSPYNGSFFSAQLPADGSAVVAGLRGHLFRAQTLDAALVQEAVPAQATINASLVQQDGTLVLGHQAGGVMTLAPLAGAAKASAQSAAAQPLATPPVPLLASLVVAPDGVLVAAGAFGPVRLSAAKAP